MAKTKKTTSKTRSGTRQKKSSSSQKKATAALSMSGIIYLLYSCLKETLVILRLSHYRLLGPVSLDALFIIFFVMVNTLFTSRIGELLEMFAFNLSQSSQSAVNEYLLSLNIIEVIRSHPEVTQPLVSAGIIFVLMMLSLYLIYCIFQGISWFLCYRLSERELSFSEISVRFFLVNLPWFFIIALFLFISFLIDFRAAILSKVVAEPISVIPTVLVYMALIVASYFILMSYLVLDTKGLLNIFRKTFDYGTSYLSVFGASFALIFGMIYILNLIDNLIPFLWVRLIIEIIIILSMISIARIFLLRLTARIDRQNE